MHRLRKGTIGAFAYSVGVDSIAKHNVYTTRIVFWKLLLDQFGDHGNA